MVEVYQGVWELNPSLASGALRAGRSLSGCLGTEPQRLFEVVITTPKSIRVFGN